MPTSTSFATRAIALALVLALGATGCARQLTNRQIATGAVSVLAVVGFVVLLSLQCNELTEPCE